MRRPSADRAYGSGFDFDEGSRSAFVSRFALARALWWRAPPCDRVSAQLCALRSALVLSTSTRRGRGRWD